METGLPTSKWEDWQFTNFSSLNAGDFRLSSANDVIKPPGIVPGQIPHSHLLLIINGHYQPGLSKLPKNVTISSGADHYFSHPEFYSHKNMESKWSKGLNPFYSLNTSMMNSGICVQVEENTVLSNPIQIIYLTTAIQNEIMNHPRFVFELGNNSKATFVEHYIGCLLYTSDAADE